MKKLEKNHVAHTWKDFRPLVEGWWRDRPHQCGVQQIRRLLQSVFAITTAATVAEMLRRSCKWQKSHRSKPLELPRLKANTNMLHKPLQWTLAKGRMMCQCQLKHIQSHEAATGKRQQIKCKYCLFSTATVELNLAEAGPFNSQNKPVL